MLVEVLPAEGYDREDWQDVEWDRSSRAAWRCETLGFSDILHYTAGQSECLANGRPSGGWPANRASGSLVRDVPMCWLGCCLGLAGASAWL